jgi:RluA family pseudouridine synthase
MALEAPPIPTLWESDGVWAVAKPAGLATLPERDPARPSLWARLRAQRPGPLYLVHRLDKDTSGVLLLATTPAAHRHLANLFRLRRVDKRYLAWVRGPVRPEAGTIDAPLRLFGSGRVAVDPRGRPARTDFRVLERRGDATLLELRPCTGRRHQLRAHLYHLGHPIVGDPLYGPRTPAPRLYLHAWRLGWPDPAERWREVEAPPDELFRAGPP